MRIEYPGKVSEAELWDSVSAASPKTKWRVEFGDADKALSGRLLYGDNLPILKHLVENREGAGKAKVIYIDPPLATGRAFATRDGMVAYYDLLKGHEFLEFLRKRLIFLREILADDGSIYVHIDSTIGHYVKVMMDEVFGPECFRNDITRIKCNPKNFARNAYGNIKDTILFYSRRPANGESDSITWNEHRLPLTSEEIEKQFPRTDAAGRRYATTPLHAPGETRNGPTGQRWKGRKPPVGRHWRYPPDELTKLDEAGLIEWSSTGNPRKKIYAEENKGRKIQDVWEFKDRGAERATYPTEKNLDLLKLIVKNSSDPGDLVLDAFAGSGTTLLAANDLGRRWIGIEASSLGMTTCQTRLLEHASKTGTSVNFEVADVEEATGGLDEAVPLEIQASDRNSLLPEDTEWEAILPQKLTTENGEVKAVLVDPEYRDGHPHIRTFSLPEPSNGEAGAFKFRAEKLGERMFILVLHKDGSEVSSIVVGKAGSRERPRIAAERSDFRYIQSPSSITFS